MTLQQLLDEELYQRVQERIDQINAQREETQQLRFADLSEGEYISGPVHREAVEKLREENLTLRTEGALKLALVQAGGKDLDYLLYKARAEPLTVEADGSVKGVQEVVERFRQTLPEMFPSKENNGKRIFANRLPEGSREETVTRDQFAAMGYEDRLRLKNRQPELYAAMVRR